MDNFEKDYLGLGLVAQMEKVGTTNFPPPIGNTMTREEAIEYHRIHGSMWPYKTFFESVYEQNEAIPEYIVSGLLMRKEERHYRISATRDGVKLFEEAIKKEK